MADAPEFPERTRQMLDGIEDPEQREVVVCSLQAHFRAESLSVGDEVPELSLTKLDGGDAVGTRDFVGDRPLVLVFGSYT
jgi:hypothetical protein